MEIELAEQDGSPVPGEPCEIGLPNAEAHRTRLDGVGRPRFTRFDEFVFSIMFPQRDTEALERM